MIAPFPGRSLGRGVRHVVQCLRERRWPWGLRWLKYLQLTHPIRSSRIIAADLARDSALPSLLLQAFGPGLLAETLDACRALHMKPFLAFGTLLGHYRDGGFIEHDADVDFGILQPDFAKVDALCQAMAKKGYSVRLRNEREVSFYKPHFPTLLVDFFLFYRKDDRVVYHDTRGDTVYEFGFPAEVFHGFRPVKFLGRIDALIPERVEEFLEACYGDWRTPKKEFNNVHDHPNLRILPRSRGSSPRLSRTGAVSERR